MQYKLRTEKKDIGQKSFICCVDHLDSYMSGTGYRSQRCACRADRSPLIFLFNHNTGDYIDNFDLSTGSPLLYLDIRLFLESFSIHQQDT
jgi:hypothetical protein